MFSWFLLTRSISGVNTTGVPLAELSLYMTYRTEAQRPPGDSQTLRTVHRPTAPIGRLSKTRIKALQPRIIQNSLWQRVQATRACRVAVNWKVCAENIPLVMSQREHIPL